MGAEKKLGELTKDATAEGILEIKLEILNQVLLALMGDKGYLSPT